MKRILITLSALIAVSIGIFAYTQQDGRITGADLPKTAQDFLKNHFGR
ncbi:MAG: hypothetical protein ACLVKO_02840 [Dysgonomonas sp.]